MDVQNTQLLERLFWRWSHPALGTPGAILGWTPLLRRKLGGNARARLDAFMQR